MSAHAEARSTPRRSRLRRTARLAGTVLTVVGALVIVWSLIVWRWNDPFTSIYTRWEQRKLEHSYEALARSFDAPTAGSATTPGAKLPPLAQVGRRYRAATHEGQAIGRLKVPRLGLDMVLVNGTAASSLRKGPGRDLRTYMPGEGELIYIAGHRTTYLAPFAHIDRLEAGDRITIDVPYGTFVYRVTQHVIVPADDLARLRSDGREVVALQACHPRFSARDRYIVYASRVAVHRRERS